MSDNRLRGGALAGLSAVPGAAVQSVAAPSHCGAPMEWKAPAPVAMSAYTFDAGVAEDLPPLWRCRCGFQLDGINHPSAALADLTR